MTDELAALRRQARIAVVVNIVFIIAAVAAITAMAWSLMV
jgi:hypothetical protein